MSATTFDLSDFAGSAITIGTRVKVWDADPGLPDYDVRKVVGTVISISPWEFDYERDADGVTDLSSSPEVTVRFDDGVVEKFNTSEWEWSVAYYESNPTAGKVEELDVIGPEDEA